MFKVFNLRKNDEDTKFSLKKYRHNGYESVQESNTLVELLHLKWFVTKFLKNLVTIFEIDDM